MKEVEFTAQEAHKVKQDYSMLAGYSQVRDSKYQRNLNRYYNNGKGVIDSIYTLFTTAQGYQASYSPRAGIQTSINVLKSAVDTVCSKMSQAKVRPFFNSVRGDYKTIRACRDAQVMFDQFYEEQGIYKKAPEVLRDACVFDNGVFFIDEDSLEVRRVLPFNVFIDPAEFHYAGAKGLTIGAIVEREYPLRLIVKQHGKDGKVKGIDTNYDDPSQRGEYGIVFDIVNKRKYYAYNGTIFKAVEIEYTRLPFVFLFWTNPIKGFNTTSLIDENYTIQCNIDELQVRIDEATRNSSFNTTYLPALGEVKESKLSNDAGLIVKFNAGPGGGAPVVSTPPAISSQYSDFLNMYISKIYENSGISQMGAQGKIPSNVKSAVMMDTMESLQSDRHNITLQNYIRMFVDIAECVIDCFPQDADVLPQKIARTSVKWKDVKKARESYSIQFSAGSALSKDPSTKIEQIQQLQALGVDVKDILPSLLEIPDLEKAYSVNTASYDYVQSIIQKCCETGDADFLPIVDMNMLYKEGVRWMLRLSADEANIKYVENMKKLLDKVMELQAQSEPQEEPAPAPTGAPVPPMPAPIV